MKYVENLGYKIILTEIAQYHLRNIAYYVRYILNNPNAADKIIQDAEDTMDKLKIFPQRIKLCEEPDLAIRGYRVILFQTHDYLMLYRVEENAVYIDGIYHQLQNYQNLFK